MYVVFRGFLYKTGGVFYLLFLLRAEKTLSQAAWSGTGHTVRHHAELLMVFGGVFVVAAGVIRFSCSCSCGGCCALGCALTHVLGVNPSLRYESNASHRWFLIVSPPPPPVPTLFLLSVLDVSILILFVQSRPENEEWVLSTTTYGGKAGEPSEHFISSVQKGNVTACQFHPEKSGKVHTIRYDMI